MPNKADKLTVEQAVSTSLVHRVFLKHEARKAEQERLQNFYDDPDETARWERYGA